MSARGRQADTSKGRSTCASASLSAYRDARGAAGSIQLLFQSTGKHPAVGMCLVVGMSVRPALCDPALGSTGTLSHLSLSHSCPFCPCRDLQITIKEVLDITQTGENENMKS